jgi:two-component system KDP operon response regulator KdpE
MTDNGPRVLIVDDEQAIKRFLRVTLTSQGYTVFEASSGLEALTTAANYKPDIIILDLGLPDMGGSESDKIKALDAGADDYLTKPFSVGELLARLRANLRRTSQAVSEPVFENGDLVMDLSKRIVTLEGREIQLTPTEYDLLKMLVTHAGKVLTHHQLLRDVWGKAYEQEFHILHVNISNLRHKIEPDPSRPKFIITEPGVGYRLKTP